MDEKGEARPQPCTPAILWNKLYDLVAKYENMVNKILPLFQDTVAQTAF